MWARGGLQGADEGPIRSQRNIFQVANLWQRFGAAAVDWLLILVAGQAVARPLGAFWSQIGPYGRFVGIAIVFAYFGALNSRIGKGQTIGKRLAKIAVKGKNNEPIGLGRSVARIAILSAPLWILGWELPFLRAPEMSWLTGLLVVGLGAALAYSILANVEAKQGLHDFVCGTFVVDTTTMPVDEFPQTDRYHWYVCGGLMAVAAISFGAWNAIPTPVEVATPLEDIRGLRQVLGADPRFFATKADITFMYVSTLYVEAWYPGVPSEAEQQQLRLELARMAMENVERVYQFEYISIKVRSGYDLGIAAGGVSSEEIHWPSVWRSLLRSDSTGFDIGD